MKAIVYTEYGPPDVLLLKDLEKPVPLENEVLIKVHAATVNRTDCAMLRAKPFIMRFFTGLFKPKRPVLGTEFAGEIEAVGKDVSLFKAGDRVFGFDDNGLSSYAQYMTMKEDMAFTKMPENIGYDQAAASCEGAHYAYNFIKKVVIKKGDKVLVNGASGGIGSAALQFLKYYGADVTAVCSSKNTELMESLGADRVIDYLKTDFTKDAQKYSFIFDTAGKSSFSKCRPLLKEGGVYISSELGPMAQNIFLPLLTAVTGKKKVIFPFPTDCMRSILFIKTLIEKGYFKTVIDRKYPLENISEAFRYVETGEKTGNVVITVNHDNI